MPGTFAHRKGEADSLIVIQDAREPAIAQPRIISENGPQFVAKEFKEFIRVWAELPTLRSS